MNRYSLTSIKTRWDGKQVYKTLVMPTIPFLEDDIYIITNDTMYLDSLANTYYGDVSKWFIIAAANNLSGGRLSVPAGIQLRIPRNPMQVINNIKTTN